MQDNSINAAQVKAAFEGFKDPETGRDVVRMEQVHDVRVAGNEIEVDLGLTTHSAPLYNATVADAEQLLASKFPSASIKVNRVVHERKPEKLGELGLTAKSVILVGSGKGGVGKSTVAASLAYGLSRCGSKVGLVDADVYGPSIPQLLGVSGRPEIVDNKIQPIEKDGIKVMSIGFLVPEGEAVVWRGPMLHGAITQFLRDTAWGDLDYLVIDMPPGTGDIALTLSQLVPITGAVVVCTPQKVALLDAIKAIAMFRKVNIPLLGIVENMSGFICPDNNKRYDIFGKGGAKAAATELDVPFLGEIPINMGIRVNGDAGTMLGLFDDAAVKDPLESFVMSVASSLSSSSKSDPPLPSLNVL